MQSYQVARPLHGTYNGTECFLKSMFMVSTQAEHPVRFLKSNYGKGHALPASYPFSELVQAPVLTLGPTLYIYL